MVIELSRVAVVRNSEKPSDMQVYEMVKEAIDKASIPYIVAEVTMLPQNTTDLAGKEAEMMVRLMEFLDDCDDVQKVYTNADIPEDVLNSV